MPKTVPPKHFRERSATVNDTCEKELYLTYRITSLTGTDYAEGKAISKEILFSKEFFGRIKNVTVAANYNRYVNLGSPMYDREGNMVSIDSRNVGYKAFPEGRGRWRSFLAFQFLFFDDSNDKIENGAEILPATMGTVFCQDAESFVFTYGELRKEKRAELSSE